MRVLRIVDLSELTQDELLAHLETVYEELERREIVLRATCAQCGQEGEL